MNTSSAITCKVVLIGDSGVGKTSIISRYVKNAFSSDLLPTPGASFASKSMNFIEYDKIWDTAGQEKYRSLAKIYYQNCNAAILVYDVTRQASFDEVKNLWYPLLKENCPNKKLIVAIAANKCDMYDLEEVQEEQVKEFTKEIGAIFKYTSAKNANGIDNLFESLGLAILNVYQKSNTLDETVNKSITIDRRSKSKSMQKNKNECCK